MRFAIGVMVCLVLLSAGHAEPPHVVRKMNDALRKYVHPSGHCGGDAELLATSYGNRDGNVGRPVACGGVLNTRRATIAHKKWPCGTQVRLTRGARQIVATVTDRGPYTIASIDMGPATWRALGGDNSYYVCVRLLH